MVKKSLFVLKQDIRRAQDAGLLNIVSLYPQLPYNVIVFDIYDFVGKTWDKLREHIETNYYDVIKVDVVAYHSKKIRFSIYYDTVE
jgi:hypothetical protein